MQTKLSIGIDIGGTNSEVAWIDVNGKILKQSSFDTKKFNTPELLVEELGEYINIENKNFSEYNVIGIGIGAPNGNYYNGTVEFAPNLGWDGIVYLAEMFQEKTKLPTKLTNDANAAAYAEMLYGGAQKMKNFLVVTLGTGLGSGIVVNGQILYGSNGFAGELGHTIVENNGRLCGCGRKGCLETYASATGIVRTIHQFLEASKIESVLRGKADIDAKMIIDAAKSGDDCAIRSVEYTGKILGQHLSDYIALFAPEAIFLAGGLAKAHELLIPHIETSIDENILKIFKESAQVYPSKLIDQNTGLLGAAALMY